MTLALPNNSRSTDWHAGLPRSVRPYALAGFALMALSFGGFTYWGAMAPLASAVIAQGSFVATGSNKIVQHLEGGIIRELLVEEGMWVAEGQPLVRLDETVAQAHTRRLQVRMFRLEAILARLSAAAREEEEEYVTPASLVSHLDDPEIRAIDDGQREFFEGAREALSNRVGVLEENINALWYQHDGIEVQMESLERQRELIDADLAAQSALLERGIVTRSAVNAIERALMDVQGNAARLDADLRITTAQIERYEKEVIQARDDYRQAALNEMQTVEAEMEAVREELRASQDILGRTIITAPVSGVVVRMHYHTSGGVITSGTPILEILPGDVPLIIEAQIPRMQIDEVRVDQTASVRLSALNQRTTPLLEGVVTYVSADSLVDALPGRAPEEIYVARITVPPEQFARINDFNPTPGMPAEILIEAQERTFFEYLTKPIVDSMSRAFRER
ncbi:HlyD family type I secretion periplasmic adaptor subunit [Pelagibacterium lacus]|uniref:Membrane fusion protein (MFP) family protein n=1 Tax=Pelagibacterium lacus TaxID=2282655 RepID=A0A369W573_9HYPH|nr:HlyD family type I secretion periplasmic adaptor subunit [Pelagibacterium lacus]RDE09169.1 HlyD family type I secretion periplasmic adaptor subunit [Pelagibacterium lacus]